MFREPDAEVKAAVEQLKKYSIYKGISMIAENLKVFFGDDGIMRKLAKSSQTAKISNFSMMNEVITLKYRTMKIQSIVENKVEIKSEEFKKTQKEVIDIINNNEELQKIIEKNRQASKYRKMAVQSAHGGLALESTIFLALLGIIPLIVEIISSPKSKKLSAEAKKDLEKLSVKVEELKKYISKSEKAQAQKIGYAKDALTEFRNFVRKQGKDYVNNKKLGKFSMSAFIKPLDPSIKNDKRKLRRMQKALIRLKKKEMSGTLNIDEAKIKFALCIQHLKIPDFANSLPEGQKENS